MITDSMIRMFCELGAPRKELGNPFNSGPWTYATNGHYAIRVPRMAEYDEFLPFKNIETVIVPNENIPDDKWISVSVIDGLGVEHTRKCNSCGGSGKITECDECDGDGEVSWESPGGYDYSAECKRCHGDGVLSGGTATCDNCSGVGTVPTTIHVVIGGVRLNLSLLSVIAKLPNAMIAPSVAEGCRTPITFKFDGGMGIIMQMREIGD